MFDIDKLVEDTKDLTLLYVEDNEDARESTLLILEDIFDNIIVAVDGEDGLEKFQNNKVDLILTDINMPNVDGLEMSKAIKQIDYDIPIVILTALTELSTVKEAIDIGIDSFINKPIEDIDILFNKIDQMIQKINSNKIQKELEKINQDKEKLELIFNMIKNISHHWRQPLSIISTISSGYSFKIKNNIEITKKDLESADIITQKVNELSNVLLQIEQIDLKKTKFEDIEKIIEISNPIYEEKNV